MLSSSITLTCKCSQVLGISRRMPSALRLLHNENIAVVMSLTRMISRSRLVDSISSHSVTSESTQQVSLPPQSGSKAKWDLYVGLVLERKPRLTQEMSSMEKEYAELLKQYEFELSKKSDHEVRKEKDKYVGRFRKSN